MAGKLDGKVALVTGGSRGIGRAICLRLAKEGVYVIVNYSKDEAGAKGVVAEIVADGGNALPFKADVTSGTEVTNMMADIRAAKERIDILVNNAGVIRDGLLVRLSDEDWDTVLNTNLRGAFYCSRDVLRHMLRHRWGRIVNITSVSGIMGNPGQGNYSAAKAGMIGLTKATAREAALRNVTVNAVAPGFILTALTQGLPQKVQDAILAQIPVGSFGTTDDVADAVLYLCGAPYVTGEVINVNGGLHM